MAVKQLGRVTLAALIAFAVLNISCSRNTASYSKRTEDQEFAAAENASGDGESAADTLPEEETGEAPGNEPTEPFIDEVTKYLDFFFERSGIDPEWLYTNEDYIAARENFSFLSGRSVEAHYFPAARMYGVGYVDIDLPAKEGFIEDAVYLKAAPEEDLTVKALNTIDGEVYSYVLEAESFFDFTEFYYDIQKDLVSSYDDDSSPAMMILPRWWAAVFPFLPTYFLTKQNFDLELVGPDGSIILQDESTAYLSGSLGITQRPFQVENAPIRSPRMNPFEIEFGIELDHTMYLPYLPEASSYTVLYMQIDDFMIPVAAVFHEFEPTVDSPVDFYFASQFPAGEYSFRVINANMSFLISSMSSLEEFEESGLFWDMVPTTRFAGS